MSFIKIKTLSALAALTLLFTAVLPIPLAYSATLDQHNNLCGGSGLAVSGGSCKKDGKGSNQGDINTAIERIVNILSIIVGIVAVIMIIIGGFKYITSGGDSGNVASAKNTILYAIVGLIIVALAQVIVRYVINQTIGEK